MDTPLRSAASAPALRPSPAAPRRALPAWCLARCAGLALAAGLLSACASNQGTMQAATPDNSAAAAAPAPIAASGYTAVIDGVETPAPALEMGDPATVAKILDEGVNRNQVMDHLTHLCTQIGPRLTGSSNAEAAARWAAAQFESWGLQNVELREWGTIPVRFDRGPSTAKFIARIETRQRPRRGEEPQPPKVEDRTVREPEFTTLAWSAGTNGPKRGPVVRMPTTDEEFAEIIEKHPGAWVLIPTQTAASSQGIRGVRNVASTRFRQREEVRQKVAAGEIDPADLPVDDRLLFANISGFISSSRDERVWTSAAPGWRDMSPDALPKDIEVVVRLSDYDYLNSRLADGEQIDAEFDLANSFTPGPIPCYNVIAEIPGTTRPDEVVIVSAHLDSWNGPGSLGTTDNGTGSSTTLETARILMAAGARPERTIRFILWSGEEQGLLGSLAYVEQIKDQHDKISAVFVDDGGTNTQGGLACTHDMAPMLAAATAPVNGLFFDSADNKPLNVNIRPSDTFRQSGGSDHASFVRAGIPGFFWDEVGRAEYGYGWHTQHDKMDLAIPEYLQQSATCSAVTAYNLACADTLLPRWKMEEPEERQPRRRPDPAPTEGSSTTTPEPASAPAASPPATGGR